jgi:hypothetical protein
MHFSETWELFTKVDDQNVSCRNSDMGDELASTKNADMICLVQGNSPRNDNDLHTKFNVWRANHQGSRSKQRLDEVVRGTHSGPERTFTDKSRQDSGPMFNNECSNVWECHRGTGDVDFSYDYHIM